MDGKELLNRLRYYDSDLDIEENGGRYGHFLADLLLQRFSDCFDLKKAIMKARLSGLEYESLQHEAS